MATLSSNGNAVKASNRKPTRKKPPRTINWVRRPKPGHPFGVLEIAVGEGKKAQTDLYFARLLDADFGTAIELSKLSGGEGIQSPYHVNLDHEEGKHSCECAGFLRWDRCKHVQGLLALEARGQWF